MSKESIHDKKYIQWIESIEDCLAICNAHDGCKIHKGDTTGEIKIKVPEFILVDSGKLINTTFVQSMEENKKKECISILMKSATNPNIFSNETVCKKSNLEIYTILQKQFGSR